MQRTPFRHAFQREAKLEEEKNTVRRGIWRNKEDSRDVVSATFHNKWDNAVHPKDHDAFEAKDFSSDDVEGELTRWVPENREQWTIESHETTIVPDIHDSKAYNQLLHVLKHDVDYTNAETVADFLHAPFEAEYYFDGNFSGNFRLGTTGGRRESCRHCGGTGKICDADECDTYCTSGCEPTQADIDNGKDEKPLRVSDDGCSCTGCNWPSHWVECENCDGEGQIYKESFTRTFPYNRQKVLSEYPNTEELQAIQLGINHMQMIADANDHPVPVRDVVKLFDIVQNGDHQELINAVVDMIAPTLRTVEVQETDENGDPVTDEDGEPVMVEQPDPDAVMETKIELTSSLFGVPEEQARRAQTPA